MHQAGLPVDPQDLVPGTDVQPEPGGKRLRGLQQQRAPVADGTAEVVRQAAVRVRHVRAALHHDDLGRLVQPA